MNPLQVIYVLATIVMGYVLFARMKAHEARLTRLENQRANPEPKAPEKPQVKQPWEKPVVPGAKDVKAIQIGDGKLKFDSEAQVAEWV